LITSRMHFITNLFSWTRFENLEPFKNNPVFLEPTIGVLVKGTFYFIANSQWPLVDGNGKLAAEDKLRDPVVLKMNLDPR
jgi:hypothetical protein